MSGSTVTARSITERPHRRERGAVSTAWRATVRATTFNRLTALGSILCVLLLGIAFIGPFVVTDPLAQNAAALQPPSWHHLFGTDQLGRDLLARVVYGARLSVIVALASVALGLLVAAPLGVLAGSRGGSLLDEVIMRLVDVVLALPLFVLALFVLGVTGTHPLHIGPLELPASVKVIVLIAVSAMPFFARVARAATLVEMQEDYIDALRVLGVRRRTILTRELSVNVLPPVLVQAFLWMAIAILAEAALGYLGVGIQAPEPTLGNILLDATQEVFQGAWWFSVFPGLVLLLGTLGLNLVGDGLSETLDSAVRQ